MTNKYETIAVFSILIGSVGFATYLAGPSLLQGYQDSKAATQAGFAGSSDRSAAKAAGFTEPNAWREHQDKQKRAAEEVAAKAAEARAKAESDERLRQQKEREARTVSRPNVELARWEKGGFGSVGIVDVKVVNTSERGWIKDVVVSCAFFGPSGTEINSRTFTIYETVKPKQTHLAKKINVGFIDQQTKRASCRLVTAEVASEMRLATY